MEATIDIYILQMSLKWTVFYMSFELIDDIIDGSAAHSVFPC